MRAGLMQHQAGPASAAGCGSFGPRRASVQTLVGQGWWPCQPLCPFLPIADALGCALFALVSCLRSQGRR